ncbi:MAG: DNA ligase D, partial [Desulfuromonadales bacterium]|nr:DNA ligase D [Desulfuromonadales bacterium]
PASMPGARSAPQPERLSPQLAKLVEGVPPGENWLHEIKFDGYRLISVLHGGEVHLWSRNGLDWSDRFPTVTQALARLPVQQAIFDGELVILDPRGISDFQALQNYLRHGGEGRLVYYLFDLVHCQGFDLSRVGLSRRKELLRQILAGLDPESAVLRYSDHIQGEGERVYRHACRFGLEGVVSKREDSASAQGRSDHWQKVKCQQRQEFIIGGYSAPGGSRSGFGALLVGVRDAEGNLAYAGKVGTGFTQALLDELLATLQPRQVPHPPFYNPPRGSAARGVTWVRPELVAEIEFAEWTGDGQLRHPSFKGLREDKAAAEVGRERPKPAERQERSEGDAVKSGPGEVATVAGVTISNPEKILYPELGVTKLALAKYYAAVAEKILPYLVARPLTIVRCPQGRRHHCFYQKHLNESVPPPVRGVAVKEKEEEQLYLVIDDLPGLITLVQLGALEFHPWGAREDRLDRPDMVIFDLDPAPDVAWEAVIEGARALHQRLGELGLQGFVKTSGGKGLHVVVPLLRRGGWEEVKAFSRAVAEDLARREPQRYVTTMAKARRQGKIFIDFFRNSRGATSVAPYSTRAREGAPVSTPLSWDELGVDLDPADYTVDHLPRRLAQLRSDPWGDFFEVRQSITKTIRRELGL